MISGITCKEDNECIVVGSPCKKDGDCCFEKCSFVWTSLGSYCISNADSFIDKIKNIFTVKGTYNFKFLKFIRNILNLYLLLKYK